LELRFIADQQIDHRIVEIILKLGYSIKLAKEYDPKISDRDLLKHAEQDRAIIITEDKDFGEWLFAHGVASIGIIFLRYKAPDFEQVASALHQLFATPALLEGYFTTLTARKTRRRKI
jgi:predicted nuclease of predicted toxin-antitoxin system